MNTQQLVALNERLGKIEERLDALEGAKLPPVIDEHGEPVGEEYRNVIEGKGRANGRR